MAARKGLIWVFKFAIPAVWALWPAAGMADGSEPTRPVETIPLPVEVEGLPSCEIRCGIRLHVAQCKPDEVPVCQCDYAPQARCSRPNRRKARNRE